MATITFTGSDALMLLAHAKQSIEHSSGYLGTEKPGPGLLLVKDDGVYLMSNGKPILAREDGGPGSKVAYAQGLVDALLLKGAERERQRHKVRAISGDDFVEFFEAKIFNDLQPADQLRFTLSPAKIKVTILRSK